MTNAPPIKPQISHSHIPIMFGEHWCASWCWCSSTQHNNSFSLLCSTLLSSPLLFLFSSLLSPFLLVLLFLAPALLSLLLCFIFPSLLLHSDLVFFSFSVLILRWSWRLWSVRKESTSRYRADVAKTRPGAYHIQIEGLDFYVCHQNIPKM